MMLLYLCILLSVVYVTEGTDGSLKLVHVFLRHGRRTPLDNEFDTIDLPTLQQISFPGFGQLTNRGKKESYEFGKLLRTQYGSFVGSTYSSDLIEVYSTDYDRTKMTVLCLSAGFFPPLEGDWNSELKWQPIPYKYIPYDMDHILLKNVNYCPKFNKEVENLYSTEGQIVLRNFSSTVEYISNSIGKNMSSIIKLHQLHQGFMAAVGMNITLPEWSKSIFPSPLKEITIYRHKFDSYSTYLRRVNGGKIIKMVLKHIEKKVANDNILKTRKMYIYGVHDLTIHAILSVLKLEENEIPSYNAAVMLELHYLADVDYHAVKVLYSDEAGANPVVQKLPECDILCPLDQFKRILEPYLPGNLTKECESITDLETYDI